MVDEVHKPLPAHRVVSGLHFLLMIPYVIYIIYIIIDDLRRSSDWLHGVMATVGVIALIPPAISIVALLILSRGEKTTSQLNRISFYCLGIFLVSPLGILAVMGLSY